ncbi:MAG TPA: chloride channel protein, partial [Lachnoclostridium sp.]|nr:chloride channel protein [Lachnoclostridium sp.]
LRLDEKDMNIAVMCGMSGAFAALFGTPVAAAIFSMEVISVGVIYYAALVPCIFSAFTAAGLAQALGLPPTRFAMVSVPDFDVRLAFMMVLLGVLASGVAALFCIVLGGTSSLYKKYIDRPWVRVCAGGALIVVMTLLSGGTRYNNSGANLIVAALEGNVYWYDFLLKILFTAVTLEAGYKGGEIVPSFAIGACFGCLFGQLLGLQAELCAACGMLALFVGVTNAPISTLIIGLEMFGYTAMPCFAIVIAVSFTLSGYYSLYSSQKAVYSKTKTEYVNMTMHTNMKMHPFE